jgi:hypothetical protein
MFILIVDLIGRQSICVNFYHCPEYGEHAVSLPEINHGTKDARFLADN